MTLPPPIIRSPTRAQFYQRLLEKLRGVPGIQGASAMSGLPPNRPLNANDTESTTTPRQRKGRSRTSITTRRHGRLLRDDGHSDREGVAEPSDVASDNMVASSTRRSSARPGRASIRFGQTAEALFAAARCPSSGYRRRQGRKQGGVHADVGERAARGARGGAEGHAEQRHEEDQADQPAPHRPPPRRRRASLTDAA